MKLLENVNETLVSSYFSSQEVVRDKFQVLQAKIKSSSSFQFTDDIKSPQDLSSEDPFWDTRHPVPSLSDVCLRSLVRCFSWKPVVSSRLRGHDKQRSCRDNVSV